MSHHEDPAQAHESQDELRHEEDAKHHPFEHEGGESHEGRDHSDHEHHDHG